MGIQRVDCAKIFSVDFKKISLELTNGRVCNGRSFNAATLSPARNFAETGLSSPSVGNWSTPDLLNPHIADGMKGRVDWPQPAKKQSLKAKLMEGKDSKSEGSASSGPQTEDLRLV